MTAARTAYRRGLRPYLARCLTAIAKRTGEDYPEPYLERQLSACHERPRADDAGSVGAFQDANKRFAIRGLVDHGAWEVSPLRALKIDFALSESAPLLTILVYRRTVKTTKHPQAHLHTSKRVGHYS